MSFPPVRSATSSTVRKSIRYEDPSLGIYKKLTLKDGKLAGRHPGRRHRRQPSLHGLVADRERSGAAATGNSCFPPDRKTSGIDVAQMADSETVCGCMGVTKGTIIQAIHEKGVSTLAQLKECTRASTGCGSCTELCQSLLKAVVPEFEEEVKRTICKCVPFAEDQLARDPAQPATEVRAGSSGNLRQRHRL